jgi:hypothetical protein
MNEPQKWYRAYPQGTKQGDEEQKFFKAIARHPKFDWRSVASLSAETGLPKKRIEEIIAKYFKVGMVFQNPKNEDQWGYWENHKNLLPKAALSISDKDTKNRLDKVIGKSSTATATPVKKKKKVVASNP